ncbi:hypothetical protein ACWET9_25990 [Streptomyces sp. NPDC004059]
MELRHDQMDPVRHHRRAGEEAQAGQGPAHGGGSGSGFGAVGFGPGQAQDAEGEDDDAVTMTTATRRANDVSKMGEPVVQSCAKSFHLSMSVPCAKLWT